MDQVTSVDISPLATCLLHDLPQTQHDLGWAPHWKADFDFNPRYTGWRRLPRLRQSSPSARRDQDADRARESSEERPAREAPPPRPMARRGRPPTVPERQPEARRIRKKPRIVPRMPPSSSEDEPMDTLRSRVREQRPPPPPSTTQPRPPPSAQPPPPSSIVLSARNRLEREWQAACAAAGAAPIYIGDRDEDDWPRVVDDFRYIESGYDMSGDIPPSDEGFVAGCFCEPVCRDAFTCQCAEELPPAEDELIKSFAYNKNRSFLFDRPMGTVIIECNEKCQCDPRKCPNRVAQRPRDVPLQLFKTDSRGWGVRSPKTLQMGKVLGIYTGKLIARRTAAKITGENKSYIFDLDAQEEAEDFPERKKYSVDAYRQGNWTRFVNHSCEPNLEVYPVVWDTSLGENRPYLAFVTKQEIPAGTELTIDYDPKAARDRKGKGRQRPGTKDCRCGTERCRGWIAV